MTEKADLSVTPRGGDSFQVEIRTPAGATTHSVRVTAEMLGALRWRGSATELVRESFDFLLEREPPESILRTFDLDVIERYFPGYQREIARRAAARQEGQSS